MANLTQAMDLYEPPYITIQKLREQTEKQLDSYRQYAADIEQKLDQAEQKLGMTKQELETTQQKLGITEQELKTTQQKLGIAEQELETTRHELGVTEQKLETTQQKLGMAEQKLGTTQQKLGVTEQKLETTQQKLGMAEQKLGTTQQKLGMAERESLDIKSRVVLLQKNLDGIKTRSLNAVKELDGMRESRISKLVGRFRRFDLLRMLNPAFQQFLDDSYLFQNLKGFLLQPSVNLQKVEYIAYYLEFNRPGLSSIRIAPLLDIPLQQGILGIEIVSPENKIILQQVVSVNDLGEDSPGHFIFTPIPGTRQGIWEIRMFARAVEGPIRLVEWRRYSLGGLGRLKTRAFFGFDFSSL